MRARDAAAGLWADYVGHGGNVRWEAHAAVLAEILPPPHGLTVDAGCGEGRFTRDLAAARGRCASRASSRQAPRGAMQGAHWRATGAHLARESEITPSLPKVRRELFEIVLQEEILFAAR
jgi:hypothetical protein